jgi:hypothetical protein
VQPPMYPWLTTHLATCSASRCISTSSPASEKHFGGISDDDRIFQNIYGRHDTSIKVRVVYVGSKGGIRAVATLSRR